MDQGDTDWPVLLATDLDYHFKELVLTYQHQLYAFALRQTGSPQDAEDIVQEALIRAYYALDDYSPQRLRALKIQPWLYKIVLNVFYNRVRSSRLQVVPLDTTENSALLAIEGDWREQPDMLLEDTESLHELEALVARLPEQYREAVNLYYFEGFNYREIAELLNQPMGTIKSSLHRGLRVLRTMLTAQRREVR